MTSDDSIPATIAGWDGLAVLSRFDPATESWCFIALHDDTLGPATGGTRMKVYDTPAAGLRDAQRLAEGMTHKWASIELGFGGGKCVLALSRPLTGEEHAGLLTRYARVLNGLRGAFATGQDLGTSTEDLRRLARRSPHVHGYDPASDTMIDPGPYTATGVYHGLRAACFARWGESELRGRSILIEGYGGVGRPLAQRCAEAGAELLFADLDDERAAAAAREHGGRSIVCSAVAGTEVDIYAPCAVGATLHAASIAALRCQVVAGSANNQLATPDDAARLHERGILYAPDYMVNAGGALAFGLRNLGQTDEGAIRTRLAGLEAMLIDVFREAAEAGEPPLVAARRRVDRVLQQARERRLPVQDEEGDRP